MYAWWPQGSMGAPPEEFKFMVYADGPNPSDPNEPYTWRIAKLRHTNNSTQYRSQVTVREYRNGSFTTLYNDIRQPGTESILDLPTNSDYRLDYEGYNLFLGWVDRNRWTAAATKNPGN